VTMRVVVVVAELGRSRRVMLTLWSSGRRGYLSSDGGIIMAKIGVGIIKAKMRGGGGEVLLG